MLRATLRAVAIAGTVGAGVSAAPVCKSFTEVYNERSAEHRMQALQQAIVFPRTSEAERDSAFLTIVARGLDLDGAKAAASASAKLCEHNAVDETHAVLSALAQLPPALHVELFDGVLVQRCGVALLYMRNTDRSVDRVVAVDVHDYRRQLETLPASYWLDAVVGAVGICTVLAWFNRW